jgi:hypothetical protein
VIFGAQWIGFFYFYNGGHQSPKSLPLDLNKNWKNIFKARRPWRPVETGPSFHELVGVLFVFLLFIGA